MRQKCKAVSQRGLTHRGCRLEKSARRPQTCARPADKQVTLPAATVSIAALTDSELPHVERTHSPPGPRQPSTPLHV